MVTFGLGPSGLIDAGSLQVREAAREVVSSGFRPLDSLLPAGGVRRGSLIEWLAGGAIAGGAATLAAAVACRLARAAQRSRTILVVDRSGWFHPPAILPWLGREGGGLQLVVARPSRDEDEIWAIDQALRCAGVAAVLAWPRMQAAGSGLWPAAQRRSPPHARQQWSIAMRRWQLAAKSSGAVGLLVRPAAAQREPSWAEARIAVTPLPGGTLLERRLRLERAGGAWPGAANGAWPGAANGAWPGAANGAWPGAANGAWPGAASSACPGAASSACPGAASSACPGAASSACPGAAGNQSVEIVIDLEYGAASVGRTAGVSLRAAEGVRSGAVRSGEAIGPAASVSERGVSCRAS